VPAAPALDGPLTATLLTARERAVIMLMRGADPQALAGALASAPAAERLRFDGLSRREAEVADLMARGLSTREIASALGISPNTVKIHTGRVLRKTGARNRRALILRAVGLAAAEATTMKETKETKETKEIPAA
jgi:DNA-binding CsgD family transcriptional regulator